MESAKKIRVLIVDDSLVFREVLAKGISTNSNIVVVAKAANPFEARDKILQFHPDVMICDIEMPKMNGIEFIRRLLPQYPLPVIVVSSLSTAVFDAMSVGAVDFLAKPSIQSSSNSVEDFIKELTIKIKTAYHSKIQISSGHSQVFQDIDEKIDISRVVAIGASTGGTEALFKITKKLPSVMPGILIVQHIPPLFSKMFAERLNSHTNLYVKEAENGDYLEQGKILIAPGGKHMKIKKLAGKYKVSVFEGEKVNGHCPSVDVLFESVAKEVGNKAIGIILTGMGYDGAKGLLAIKRSGGRTIGQDEGSSVVYGMPKVAFNIGAVEKQTSLQQIPNTLLSMLKK